ncbi:MAG: helix-turn-helix domain-containing protein [Acidobacteriia bacterium]|nr:helix-turn-helix domain-containing protein [Terriglobia bacterium]
MTSIGETLRRERLKRNLDLARVSGELKIPPRMLEAIEDERFDRLPGGVFAKSFVRQYAHLLGLDEEEIVGELQRMLEPQPAGSQAPHPVIKRLEEVPLPRVREWDAVADKRSRWSSSLPALALVLVVMLVCSALYSWLQRSRRPVSAQEAPPAPAAVAVTPPAPVSSTASPSAAPAPEPNPAANPAATGAAPAAPNGNVPPESSPVAETAPAKPGAAVRVELTAEEPVWVSARADGQNVFSSTLAANESRTVDAASTILLRLGNAGGIRISLNGKPIGPVGAKGQIRSVQLTSGGFQIVPPEPSKSAPSSLLDPL